MPLLLCCKGEEGLMSGDKSKSLQRFPNDAQRKNWDRIFGRCSSTVEQVPCKHEVESLSLSIGSRKPYCARPLYPGVVGVVTE